MPDSAAAIRFLEGWRQEVEGTIERGHPLVVKYDLRRLAHCFVMWRGAELGDIVAHLRFHPRGEIVQGSVAAPESPAMAQFHVPVPLSVTVPCDATQVELWFHGFSQTSSRCDAWDSRFGQNYVFEVGGSPPRTPAQPVAHRSDALTRPDMVNVLEQSATTENVFPPSAIGPGVGVDMRTKLKVVSWVGETTWGANAWIDVHVFDERDDVIHAETLPLSYAGWGSQLRYELSGVVYRGTDAGPGWCHYRPSARMVQYRLYYQLRDEVCTDGILHQIELAVAEHPTG